MGIHLFHYVHGGERMALCDVMQNNFVIIVRNAKFDVLQKQTHVLLPPTLQSSCCRIYIMLLVNGIHTLAFGDKMTSHDVMRDVFAFITKNVGFHVSWK